MNRSIISAMHTIRQRIVDICEFIQQINRIRRISNQITAGHNFPVVQSIVENDVDAIIDEFFDKMIRIDDANIGIDKQHPVVRRKSECCHAMTFEEKLTILLLKNT